jgi:hypothetical protein
MAHKSLLEAGQRVKFFRTHDKATELTGTILKVHDGSDLVDIATEPDGKAIEIETLETAHVSDVTPIAELTPIAEETVTETSDESAGEQSTGTESFRSGRRRR